ncbi:MAG: hypothetical protein OHK0053_09580 [Microscillaceae bacterium]
MKIIAENFAKKIKPSRSLSLDKFSRIKQKALGEKVRIWERTRPGKITKAYPGDKIIFLEKMKF